jgi:sortase A
VTATDTTPASTGTDNADPETDTTADSRSVTEDRRSTLSPSVRFALVAVIVLGALALWFLLYAAVFSRMQEHSAQGRLYNKFRSELAQETSPIGAPIPAGQPVALIDAPHAGISKLVVVEGTTSEILRNGPGHLSDSPLPGQVGTAYIFGRSEMFGGPFGSITHLGRGDTVTVTTGQGVFPYRVEDVRHPGDSLPAPLGSNGSRLTLVSSTSGGWRSGWAPDQVVYVDAVLAHGKASGLPAPVPSSVGRSSTAMQDDPKAVVPLIFWLEGLIAVAVAALWSWRHWGRLQTWMVGLPVILGMLWGATGALAAFLPNLV